MTFTTKDAVKKTCPECPWSRQAKPGALGGSPPETYLGQIVGPFLLPCHMHCDFSDPQWREKMDVTAQCAGAAIFRANIGVDTLMPDPIARQPKSTEHVFANAAEFLAHHAGVSVAEARKRLQATPVVELLRREVGRQIKVYPVSGKPK